MLKRPGLVRVWNHRNFPTYTLYFVKRIPFSLLGFHFDLFSRFPLDTVRDNIEHHPRTNIFNSIKLIELLVQGGIALLHLEQAEDLFFSCILYLSLCVSLVFHLRKKTHIGLCVYACVFPLLSLTGSFYIFFGSNHTALIYTRAHTASLVDWFGWHRSFLSSFLLLYYIMLYTNSIYLYILLCLS